MASSTVQVQEQLFVVVTELFMTACWPSLELCHGLSDLQGGASESRFRFTESPGTFSDLRIISSAKPQN